MLTFLRGATRNSETAIAELNAKYKLLFSHERAEAICNRAVVVLELLHFRTFCRTNRDSISQRIKITHPNPFGILKTHKWESKKKYFGAHI